MKFLINLIKKYWLALTFFFLSIITILSLTPLPELPPFPGNDKTHHFIAYGILILPTALKKPQNWLIVTLFFIGWSGVIELIQPLVNRYGELMDLIANIGGLVCGWFLGQIILLIGSRSPNS